MNIKSIYTMVSFSVQVGVRGLFVLDRLFLVKTKLQTQETTKGWVIHARDMKQ